MSLKNGFLKAFSSLIPVTTGFNLPAIRQELYPINSGLTIYPYGKDQTFIREGYNKNAFVYSIVSKCAKKFAQVPWYHYRIKRGERKTWNEYVQLTKDGLNSRSIIEAKKMRTKAIDQVIVDDDLSKLIARPNRNQSGAQYREQLYGYKLLTGEGNIWISRPDNQKPQELFIIPKDHLALVKGGDPWAIDKYKLLLGGQQFLQDKENIIMWKFPNYEFDESTLTHLRGQAPLDAGILLLQASNEGQERIAAMNKNQGVAGLAYNKADNRQWSVDQAMFNRRQFNSIINDSDLAGTIAYMNGDWGYLQFGMSVEQLQILEQANVTMDTLCNIFDVPPGMFSKDQTYNNRKEQKREFVYDNIAVAAYGLRDELNAKLIPAFDMDRERDVLDFDIMALPELVEDLKDQVMTLKEAGWLTIDEKRTATGYDELGTEASRMVFMPSGLQTLEEAAAGLDVDLDSELKLLGNDTAGED